MVDHTTVLIVGAGPAGLVLGNLLQGAGIGTLVVERGGREQVQARARAGFLGPHSAKVLAENGLGAGMLVHLANKHDWANPTSTAARAAGPPR